MHPRVLRKMLGTALAAATGVGLVGCGECAFGGNHYGPYEETHLELAPAGMVSAAGPIDDHGCRAVCGEFVTSCDRVEPPKPTGATLNCLCRAPGAYAHDKSMKCAVDTPSNPALSVCQPCCDDGETTTMTVEECSVSIAVAMHVDPSETLVICRLRMPGGCTGYSGGGRPPRGLVAPVARAEDVAGFFARMAYFERASVAAFVDLADALVVMGAPRSLVRRARRSARDEARHARAMAAIARSRGAPVERPRVRAMGPCAAVDLARENAVEGCVHETLGALLAMRQATHARDAGVRAAMAAIADDEIRHAALSWDVHRFLVARLDDAGRADVHAAMRAAVGHASRLDVPRDVREAVGLPSDDETRAIVAALRESLWQSHCA